MSEIKSRLNEISDKMNEHMMAVKGTLELVDASVSEDDLHNLLFKAINRMESLQTLSDELFAALQKMLEKIEETKGPEEGR
jgi:hypothetical protein